MKLRDCKHGTIVRKENTTYRLYRCEVFQDGTLGTMKPFARIQKCDKRDTGWWDDHNQTFLIRSWDDECEIVDDSNTAIAGERLILSVNVP